MLIYLQAIDDPQDRTRFEAMYSAYRGLMFHVANRVLQNTQDAEDVLHDCYLQIYSAAAKYQASGKPMAWILTITRNLCLLKLRERRRMADRPS